MFINDVHAENAELPILCTELGIFIFLKDSQPQNAPSPMLVML